MKEKIKYFNVVQIIGNILLLISVIGSFVATGKIQNTMIGLFWFALTINMLGITYFFATWTKGGINADVKKSKQIFNDLDNVAVTLIVGYMLAYLIIIFITNMSSGIRNNFYLIGGSYILTVFVEVILFTVVEKAYKETIKLVKKNNIGKNDKSDRKK